jgi:hypothetical protein
VKLASKIIQKIVEELVQKLSMALPDYQKHLEPFFNLKKPIIEPQLKKPKMVKEVING